MTNCGISRGIQITNAGAGLRRNHRRADAAIGCSLIRDDDVQIRAHIEGAKGTCNGPKGQMILRIIAGDVVMRAHVGTRYLYLVGVGVVIRIGGRIVVVTEDRNDGLIDFRDLNGYFSCSLAAGSIGSRYVVSGRYHRRHYLHLTVGQAVVPGEGVGRIASGGHSGQGYGRACTDGLVGAQIYRNGRNHLQRVVFHFTVVVINACGRYAAIVVDVEAGIGCTAFCIGGDGDGKGFGARSQRSGSTATDGDAGDDFFRGLKGAIAVEVYPAIEVGIGIVSAPGYGDVFGAAGRKVRTSGEGNAILIIGAVIVVAVGIGRALHACFCIGLDVAQPGRRAGIGNNTKIAIGGGQVAIVVGGFANGTGIVFDLTRASDTIGGAYGGFRQTETRVGSSRHCVSRHGIGDEYRLQTCCIGHYGIVCYTLSGVVKEAVAVEVHPNGQISTCACLISQAYFHLLIGAGCAETGIVIGEEVDTFFVVRAVVVVAIGIGRALIRGIAVRSLPQGQIRRYFLAGFAVRNGSITKIGGYIAGFGYGNDIADDVAAAIAFICDVNDQVTSIHGEVSMRISNAIALSHSGDIAANGISG